MRCHCDTDCDIVTQGQCDAPSSLGFYQNFSRENCLLISTSATTVVSRLRAKVYIEGIYDINSLISFKCHVNYTGTLS